MQTKKPHKKKRFTLGWIILGIIVLLAAGFGGYAQWNRKRPIPAAMPAVVRVKIPPPSASAIKVPTAFPTIQPETVKEDAAAVNAANNDANGVQTDSSGPADPSPVPDESGKIQGPAAVERQAIVPLAPRQPAVNDPALPGPTSMQTVASSPAAQTDLPEETHPVSETEQPAPFTIQVGAYRTKRYADQAVTQLVKKGYDAYIFERTDKKQQIWYLVRFGHFQDRAAAAQVLTDFKDQEHSDASLALSHAK